MTILELEGKLTGPWVAELEGCWRALAGDNSLRVHLREVTFIDDQGKAMLCAIRQSGAELSAAGCMTKAIVEEICSTTAASEPGSGSDDRADQNRR